MALVGASWANIGLGPKIGWDRGGLPVVILVTLIAAVLYFWVALLICGCIYICAGLAFFMTLVASAHRHDLDVQMYLADVITHLNRGTAKPDQLLPDVWKASHPEAIRTYRETERRDKAELARMRTASRISQS